MWFLVISLLIWAWKEFKDMAKLEDEVKMNQKVQVEQEGFEPGMSGWQPSDLATRLRSQDDKFTELSRT